MEAQALEQGEAIKQDSPREKAENIYSNIERKIALAKKVWTEAKNLPPPLVMDSEIAKKEKDRFDVIFQSALTEFPEGATKYKRWKKINEIKDKRRAQQAPNKRYKYNKLYDNTLPTEQHKIEQDEDFLFLYKLDRGIKGALGQRERVRELIGQYGTGKETVVNYSMIIPPRYADIKGQHIKDVIVENFSITLVIEARKFDSLFLKTDSEGRIKEMPRAEHIDGTVINFVKQGANAAFDDLFKTHGFLKKENDVKASNREIKTQRESSLHENFHSFFEGFLMENEKDIEDYKSRIKQDVSRLIKLKEEFPPETKWRLQDLKIAVESVWNVGWDEILAELVSLDGRIPEEGAFPNSTFAQSLNSQKIDFLNSQKGLDGNADRIMESVRNRFNIDMYRQSCARIFKTVREKIPGKLEDVELAFAVLKPSQVRHIGKLVERWVAQESNSRPNLLKSQGL